jgi:hypothetical protein
MNAALKGIPRRGHSSSPLLSGPSSSSSPPTPLSSTFFLYFCVYTYLSVTSTPFRPLTFCIYACELTELSCINGAAAGVSNVVLVRLMVRLMLSTGQACRRPRSVVGEVCFFLQERTIMADLCILRTTMYVL